MIIYDHQLAPCDYLFYNENLSIVFHIVGYRHPHARAIFHELNPGTRKAEHIIIQRNERGETK